MIKKDDITAQDITEFQAFIEEAANDPRAFLPYVWPYILPGMEKHLPSSVVFDGWEDDELDENGLRCARLRKEPAI